MKQIYKYTPLIVLVSACFYCLSSQFYLNSYSQNPAADDTQTKTKDKPGDKKKDNSKGKAKDKRKVVSKTESTDWWANSKLGAKFIYERKYLEAESVLSHVLPQARHDAPDSLELAISLERYGIALFAEQKYAQSLTALNEAIKILSKKPASLRQQKALFQCLGCTAATLAKLQKFNQAEPIARKTIAYSIAFQNVTQPADINKMYVLLRVILENQNKMEEASTIADIIDYLHCQ